MKQIFAGILFSCSTVMGTLKPLDEAMLKLDNVLYNFTTHVTRPDIVTIVEYMKYYKSWYQAVTPAPIKLVNALSQQDKRFIEQVKQIVQPFQVTSPTARLGASTLTRDGEILYEYVLAKLKRVLMTAP